MNKFKMSNIINSLVLENRDNKIISNIMDNWVDNDTIRNDIKLFLMDRYDNRENDYESDDVVKSIQSGIDEFRKIYEI